jgi:hypothetical protein
MKRITHTHRKASAQRAACIGFAAVLVAAFSSPCWAQSLGLNFASTDPDAATSALNPTDLAGVVPAANWNNLEGGNGTNVGGLEYNNNGAPVASAATVTWRSPNTWRSGGNNGFAGPNAVLYSGYIDTGDTTAGGITLTVNNIDAALRNQSYDVYVYLLGDSPDDRGGGYRIDDGIVSILKYGSTMAAPTEFLEDPGDDIDNSVDGNYLRFRQLVGTSFTITTDATLTTPNGFRAPINAIQIVGGQPAPSGDANGDGQTNLADYTLIRNNIEKAVPALTMGDLTGDAYVDLKDFRRWTQAPKSPAEAASIGVPEPSAATLGVLALLLGAVRMRKRGA